MDEEASIATGATGATGRNRRSRGPRGKLKKHQDIEQVQVEQVFSFKKAKDNVRPEDPSSTTDNASGEGCYISATFQNRRYYGVLIEQSVLQEATLLHFQDEASGLDLNRRMKVLMRRQQELSADPISQSNGEQEGNSSRSLDHTTATDNVKSNGNSFKPPEISKATVAADPEQSRKRPRSGNLPEAPLEVPSSEVRPNNIEDVRQVQKFRYIDGHETHGGYRSLLATFSDVRSAAEDNEERKQKIETACQSGGGFVGEYYYQFEGETSVLKVSHSALGRSSQDSSVLKMSMGFQSFLQKTSLPDWHPLSNNLAGQQKVLNILNMKKDKKGNVVWGESAESGTTATLNGSLIPMEPRAMYRVCVVGGGIGGLSSCLEIFRHCERDRIDVEVVLVEGRSRLGGRMWTDRETFKDSDGSKPFPVDLGASWIHGIDLNPLAAAARAAGVDFVRTSEDVKMLQAGMREVDAAKDHHAGELFDKLLDMAAESCWSAEEIVVDESPSTQSAVRWYAQVLAGERKGQTPQLTGVPPHRSSSDISVDRAIGHAIANLQNNEFEDLADEERRMLFWNVKNVEYALGANLRDLSMKFWDIDERHAFEGDHVILRQGYSVVVDHILKQLQLRGSRFKFYLNFDVKTIEYARKTSSQPYLAIDRKSRMVDISDTCCVTSQKANRSINCDFVVCAVPLGVLKDALEPAVSSVETDVATKLSFDPALPFVKQDAIRSVGFGLLNKVYLQFPFSFWRQGENSLKPEHSQFGNASGVNSHHYMFFDVGSSLSQGSAEPSAILMSLVSGSEAVDCENMSPEMLVEEAMTTLRVIFSDPEIIVPDPIATRTTNWGQDPFSRGSYTFLPPGTTDQDFQSLQSPINGNGDSLLLEGSETMRLFFSGEHTTALHPSMAHGAMLSGVRAAEEVLSALTLTFEDDDIDRLIPLSLFRYLNPDTKLDCDFCRCVGSSLYKGSLLAFKKGSRLVLVHNCCAEYSPEVEVTEGKWKNVLKSVNRAVSIECYSCGHLGASIGCHADRCYRSYHFSCAEATKWRFQDDGKEFFCEAHRPFRPLHRDDGSPSQEERFKKEIPNLGFQHALFAQKPKSSSPRTNRAFLSPASPEQGAQTKVSEDTCTLTADLILEDATETLLIHLSRASLDDSWDIQLVATPLSGDKASILCVAATRESDPLNQLIEGDVVKSLNGIKIGFELKRIEDVIALLRNETEILMEVERSQT